MTGMPASGRTRATEANPGTRAARLYSADRKSSEASARRRIAVRGINPLRLDSELKRERLAEVLAP